MHRNLVNRVRNVINRTVGTAEGRFRAYLVGLRLLQGGPFPSKVKILELTLDYIYKGRLEPRKPVLLG